MDEYKPNSYKQRALEEDIRKEKVVQGKVTTKKRSGARRFLDLFLAEDIGNVKEYLIFDLLIPAIKNTVVDVIKNTTDLLAYGKVKTGSSTTKASNILYSNYSSMYNQPRKPVPQQRVGLNFDDIIFESRGDAELVLDTLKEYVDIYGQVTVRDFLDTVGISGEGYTNYTQENYGWKDLRDAYVSRIREGYLLVMPRVVQLD